MHQIFTTEFAVECRKSQHTNNTNVYNEGKVINAPYNLKPAALCG